MDTFTEAYQKGAGLLKTKCFDPRWAAVETRLKTLMAAHGPDDGGAKVLDDIRQRLDKAGEGTDDSGEAIAEEMMVLCRRGDRGYQDRVAFLEMLRHFYLVKQTDNQRVWVLDGTLKFRKWVFDEFDGDTRHELKRKIEHEPFMAFGSRDREMFVEALQRARKWTMDIVADLGRPDQDTLDVVRRWFHTSHASEASVKGSAKTLLDGFKKIAAFCNAGSVIFSDDPPNRGKHADGSYWLASVDYNDKLPVIYLYPSYTKFAKKNVFGRYPKLWLAALTIIHELSHKLMKTKDLAYDHKGIKPGGATMAAGDSINNADSWGYFAADMVGALPEDDMRKVYK